MTDKYEDIIHLPHHVSKKHPQMPIADRAAQFAPFAALTGYGEQIKETARTTEEFHQVSGREKEELDQKLQILQQTQYKHPLISIYYFAPDARKQGGHYNKTTGCVKKIDVINEKLMMIDGNEIAFINPSYIEDKAIYEEWKKAMQEIEVRYMRMKELGATTDMCREVLPHSVAAEYVMTANIREWKHILSLRTTKHVHPSIRQVLIPLLRYFQEEMPEIFADIEYDKEFDEKYYAKIMVDEEL